MSSSLLTSSSFDSFEMVACVREEEERRSIMLLLLAVVVGDAE